MSDLILGYFDPAHITTMVIEAGRSGPLSKTTLTHEESHDVLFSWSMHGHFGRTLAVARRQIIRNDSNQSAMEDLEGWLGAIVGSAWIVHEGFATYAQLEFIDHRFGTQVAGRSWRTLDERYRYAMQFCSKIRGALEPKLAQRKLVSPGVQTALRSFVIAALNHRIFDEFPEFDAARSPELDRFLDEPVNEPDGRFLRLLQLQDEGDLAPLHAQLAGRAFGFEGEYLACVDPAERKALVTRFAWAVNRLTAQYLVENAYLPLDDDIFDGEKLRTKRNRLLRSVGRVFQIDLGSLEANSVMRQRAYQENMHVLAFRPDPRRDPPRGYTVSGALQRAEQIRVERPSVVIVAWMFSDLKGAVDVRAAALDVRDSDYRSWYVDEFGVGGLHPPAASELVRALDAVDVTTTDFLALLAEHYEVERGSPLIIVERRNSIHTILESVVEFVRTPEFVLLSDVIEHVGLAWFQVGDRHLIALVPEEVQPMFVHGFREAGFSGEIRAVDRTKRDEVNVLAAAWLISVGSFGDFYRALHAEM